MADREPQAGVQVKFSTKELVEPPVFAPLFAFVNTPFWHPVSGATDPTASRLVAIYFTHQYRKSLMDVNSTEQLHHATDTLAECGDLGALYLVSLAVYCTTTNYLRFSHNPIGYVYVSFVLCNNSCGGVCALCCTCMDALQMHQPQAVEMSQDLETPYWVRHQC